MFVKSAQTRLFSSTNEAMGRTRLAQRTPHSCSSNKGLVVHYVLRSTLAYWKTQGRLNTKQRLHISYCCYCAKSSTVQHRLCRLDSTSICQRLQNSSFYSRWRRLGGCKLQEELARAFPATSIQLKQQRTIAKSLRAWQQEHFVQFASTHATRRDGKQRFRIHVPANAPNSACVTA